MGYLKGQNFRVRMSDGTSPTSYYFVAGATSCNVHLVANLEETTTKDDTDAWTNQEVVSMSWNGSVDSLIVAESTSKFGLNAVELIGKVVDIEFTSANGTELDENPLGTYRGKAIVNDISQTHTNKQNSTLSMQFTGVGKLQKTV